MPMMPPCATGARCAPVRTEMDTSSKSDASTGLEGMMPFRSGKHDELCPGPCREASLGVKI
uniref:Uncharacterized protein n=1 Tax=Arundo donax TaxID=35708 RepID=A0A0A9B7F3_ARUDO